MSWIRRGAIFAPPSARAVLDVVIARIHADRGQVARVVRSGPLKGWTALPARSPLPAGVRVDDQLVYPYAPAIKTRGLRLRPYQDKAVRAWGRAVNGGVLVAPCGAGKTMMGLAIIATTPTPALILVHRQDLAAQWIERGKALGIEVSVASPGRKVGRVTVATFQSLGAWTAAQRAALGDQCGLVVIDEAHHVPARTWGAVLSDLRGRRRLALTATPERHDDKTPLLYAHVGPVFAEVDTAELQQLGATLVPTVHQVRTGFTPGDGKEAHTNAARNRKIRDRATTAANEGRRVLILVERVAHADALAKALRRGGIKAQAVHGQLAPVDRSERIEGLRAGVLQVLTATSVADEGLDLPELDTVILATPGSSLGRVQQRIGRALRPDAAKLDAQVFDLVDKGDAASKAWSRRLGLYTSLGWSLSQSALARSKSNS